MTLSDEAKLYIIEPYLKPESRNRKGIRNHRRMLKEHERHGYSYLHCSDLCLGDVHLKIQGGMGSPMDSDNYGMIQLFFDMMDAGWTVPEWLKEAAKHSYDALKQCCPKGMCYIGIEYECSKNYNLTFYSKQYLKSRPETHQGSSHFLMMRLKPDQETGTHGLPLKGCVIQTPVPPDTIKIPAELFLYHERVDEWTETIM